jgi:hypothetical protein
MSGKHCGPSKAALDLDKKIGGAMDTVKDSFIGSAAGGIADGIAGLKSSLTGLTDGIAAEIENAIPEIPKPKANLQEQMTKLMSNLDNPGALLSELEGIKGNFGGKINIDDMLSKAGVDPSKLEGLSAQFKDLQKKAQLQNTVGALGKLATGDLSAVKDLMGGIPSITLPGSDPASILDAICKDVPNLDLDADGNVIKKGIETKLPAADAEAVEEAAEANITAPPEKDIAPADKLETSANVILNPNTEEAQKIEQEYIEALEIMIPLKEAIAERDILVKEEEQKRNNENPEIRKNAQAQIIKYEREQNKDILYIELLEADLEYVRDNKLFEANLILEKPRKPSITWDEIHERTYFSNYPKTIEQVLLIPNLEIKGERPERRNFGG